MVIVSAGIRPRDELARACGLAVGERGGVVVDDRLETSDPDIHAIGEVAHHRGMVYGLVAPGYEMAEVLAARLAGDTARVFTGADLSTKLKLMGVDVASFGDYEAGADAAKPLTYEDPFGGVYKKLLFSPDGRRLLGGILVGDASDYGSLMMLAKNGTELPAEPGALVLGSGAGGVAVSATEMPAGTQVCQCNGVSKGDICSAIRDDGCAALGDVKARTRAGTGCGGCLPLVTDLLKQELEAAGRKVSNDLCEHFPYTRQELLDIVKVKEIRTFADLIAAHGRGHGCEICKPAVSSMLASLWNENILDNAHQTLQQMEGGIDYLREVVVDDKLGICDELERRRAHLVDTYRCEWKEVVDNPELRRRFRQFVNTDETEVGIEFVDERGQQRPEYWDKAIIPVEDVTRPAEDRGRALRDSSGKRWVNVRRVADFPADGGAAVKYGRTQIAVFNFSSRGEWYATQNMCPHKQAFVLSRGIVGDAQGTPKVACPLHKEVFGLGTGACLGGESYELMTFPVRVDDDRVYLELPPEEQLGAFLGTDTVCGAAARTRGPARGASQEPAAPYLRTERPDGQVDYFAERQAAGV